MLDITKDYLKKEFDIIVANDVLEHVFNLNSSVENIKKMMHKDSFLFITVPIPTRVHLFLDILGLGCCTIKNSHVNIMSPSNWENFVFIPMGFEVVEEFKMSGGGIHVPFVDLFSVFILKLSSNKLDAEKR